MANWFNHVLDRDVIITPDSGFVLSMKDMLFKRIFCWKALMLLSLQQYNVADSENQHLPLSQLDGSGKSI